MTMLKVRLHHREETVWLRSLVLRLLWRRNRIQDSVLLLSLGQILRGEESGHLRKNRRGGQHFPDHQDSSRQRACKNGLTVLVSV